MKRNIFCLASLFAILTFPCFADELEFLMKAAKLGDAKAQSTVASMYESGTGLPKNQAEAAKWYTKAAEQGDAEAQNNLGFMYAGGRGIPLDYAQAMKWYSMAAEQGLPQAQSNLSVMYTNGLAVPKDYVKAYMWANIAAAKGSEKAVKMREALEKNMKREEIMEGQRLSNEWIQKVSEKKAAEQPVEAKPTTEIQPDTKP